MSLPAWILTGLVVGAAAGVTTNVLWAPDLGEVETPTWTRIAWWADHVVKPIGDVFLRLLFMVVVPIVFCSLFLGVAGLGSMQKLGNLGRRTLVWFLGTTALAAVLGIVLVGSVQTGRQITPDAGARVQEQYRGIDADKGDKGNGKDPS